MSDPRSAWIALAHTVEPGDVGIGTLVAQCGPMGTVDLIRTGQTGLRAGPALRSRLAAIDVETAIERAERGRFAIITPEDRAWPAQLSDLGARAPMALWVSGGGDLRLLALRSVSIVGARVCTPYGEDVARSWAASLASDGWTVLSGAAFGIDAAAHRGALSAGGATVAVVAGGVDVDYPRAHGSLLSAIRAQGLVVSEIPLGEPPRRQRFLSRNRLIAALGRATLVVEAAFRSGTSSTAHAARAMNRPVLAVPGPITSASSAGCHRMIRDGDALCVVDVDDVRGLLDFDAVGRVDVPAAASSPWDRLSERERRVLDALPRRGGLDLDEVVRAAGVAPVDAIGALAVLEAADLVRVEAGRWRASRR